MSEESFLLVPDAQREAVKERGGPAGIMPYMQAVDVLLVEKRFSYADVAEWLSKKLNRRVPRSAVYYNYQLWKKRSS